MEKTTIKFLSVLLSIALLLSFPVATYASEKSYEETFTGTYTAPENVRNVLVSGAYVSEWYGDRVNVNGHTYSVRQNQYGLNADGNMIEAKEGETYTLWLAQYGVASLKFTADETGLYMVSASDSDYGDLPYYYEQVKVYSQSDNGYTLRDYQYGYNNYSEEKEKRTLESHSSFIQLNQNETVYLVAKTDNSIDTVFNVQVVKWTQDNCTHDWNVTDKTYDIENCKCTKSYECQYCGLTKTETDVHHYSVTWKTKLVDKENCMWSDYATCDVCGEVVGGGGGQHNYDYDNPIYTDSCHYKYVCTNCGEASEHIDHDYAERYENCTYIEYCPKCNETLYTCESHEETGYIQSETKNEVGCVTRVVEWICEDCGKSHTTTEVVHAEYVYIYTQKTPQIGAQNQCGTYNYLMCEACNAYWYDEDLTCHSNGYDEYIDSDYDCEWSIECRRCGNIETNHYGDWEEYTVAPTCTEQGYTTYKCKDCGRLCTQEDIEEGNYRYNYTAPTGHKPVSANNAVAATCTTNGKAADTVCSVCGQILEIGATTAAIGHNFADNAQYCANGCGLVNPNYVAQTTTSTNTSQKETPTKPKTTSAKQVKAGKKKVDVQWKKVSGVSGYQVQVATDKKFKKNKKTVTIKKQKTTKTTVKNLKSKKKYYVRVRTYKTVNGKKVYSKWSKVKTVKTK